MPLESATTINGLVVSNPTDTDPLAEADDHIRLIKATLKTTFPNITGPITATQGDLNAANATAASVTALAAASYPKTGGPITGSLETSGSIQADTTVNGVLGVYENGARLVPRGVISLWYGLVGTIPTGWLLCDGANGTPDLRGVFVAGAGGTLAPYAAGGAPSYALTTSVVAAHNHTGATGAAGGHTHPGVTDLQGGHNHGGSTGAYALTVNEIPSHTHDFSLHGGPNVTGSGTGDWVSGAGFNTFTTTATGGGNGHAHTIPTEGPHGHNLSMAAVGDHTHGLSPDGSHSHTVTAPSIPPYLALAYIMKA